MHAIPEAKRRIRAPQYLLLVAMLCALFLASCSSPSTPKPSVSSTPPPVSVPLPLPSSAIVATPIKSLGCGLPAAAPPGTSIMEMIISGGLTREYLLHIPVDYRPSSATPLVLNFHGHGNTSSVAEVRSGMSAVADQEGFIVVYPQGLPGPDARTGWATYTRKASVVDDVLFISDLLNHLQARLCVDPRRIYATGFSNGGGMSNLLACTMAGRIAAFAPVAGAYPPYPYQGGCEPARPVALLEIHGTADGTVPYTGKASTDYPPIPKWLDGWVKNDGCGAWPTTFYEEANVTGLEWTGCKDDAAVVHYRITGGGHVWPGNVFIEPTINGEHSTSGEHTINASLLIWLFFQRHSLPEASVQNQITP